MTSIETTPEVKAEVIPAAPTRPYAEVDSETLAVRVTLLSDLAKVVAEQRDLHRQEHERRMSRGQKITAHDPDDELVTLGTVSYSNPKPEAYITDHDAFDAHCRTRYPAKIERWTEFADTEQVVALVAKHAPHLLILHESVTDETRELVLRSAVTEDVPGTARRLGKSSLTVRPTLAARRAVHRLLSSLPILRELDAPK